MASEQALAAPDFESHPNFYLFSGPDIERWLLKTLVATYRAQVTKVAPATHRLPAYVPTMFFETSWPSGSGLYVPTRSVDGEQHAVQLAPQHTIALHTNHTYVLGATVTLLGFSLRLALPESELDDQLISTSTYRPLHLNFYAGERVVSIGLASPASNRKDSVWYSRGQPHAPVPTDAEPSGGSR